jgi:antitoxin VapB
MERRTILGSDQATRDRRLRLERRIKLFRIGASQVVRIPRQFELPGEHAVVRRDGNRLILEPAAPRQSLSEFLKSLEPIDEEFPPIEDLPPDPVDI